MRDILRYPQDSQLYSRISVLPMKMMGNRRKEEFGQAWGISRNRVWPPSSPHPKPWCRQGLGEPPQNAAPRGFGQPSAPAGAGLYLTAVPGSSLW